MKSFLNKLFSNIELFFHNLVFAFKNVEDMTLHSGGAGEGDGTSEERIIQSNSVAHALLRGEVTKEVDELRYRTYFIDQEAKKFEYFSPTLALKHETKQDRRDLKYDDSDGLELITMQENKVIVKSLYEMMYKESKTNKLRYVINIERDFVPRFYIEEFTKRIDVKKIDDTHAIIELYVSKYEDTLNFKSRPFISELKRIHEQKIKSDIIDFEELTFVTKNAYKLEDLNKFVFKNIFFKEIKEFDGNYIVKFKATYEQTALVLTEKYFNEEVDNKYKNKEKKDVQININEWAAKPVYKCEVCGKEIVLDREMMDTIETYEGRDITSETFEGERTEVIEFMDMQISEQTFGKMMCTSCLMKYMEDNNL